MIFPHLSFQRAAALTKLILRESDQKVDGCEHVFFIQIGGIHERVVRRIPMEGPGQHTRVGARYGDG